MRVIHKSEHCTPEVAADLQRNVDEALVKFGRSPTFYQGHHAFPVLPVVFDKGYWTIQQQDGNTDLEEVVADQVATLEVRRFWLEDPKDGSNVLGGEVGHQNSHIIECIPVHEGEAIENLKIGDGMMVYYKNNTKHAYWLRRKR